MFWGGGFAVSSCVKPHFKNSEKNFFVLPSSIHECILVPDLGQYSREELAKMVKEVNQTQVEEEEILSYQVYYYDRQKEKTDDVDRWEILPGF